MKKLLLLTKTLLAAVLLMGGANSAWGTPTFWKATSSTVVTANQTYVSTDYLTVASTSAGTLGDYGYNYSDIGENVSKSIQIRSNAAPTAENPSGTENTGSTRLVITVTSEVKIVFYYRRQADNGASSNCTYTENNGKDLKIVNQNAPTTELTGTMTKESDCTTSNTYGHVKKAYTLSAGTYTVYATSTTIQLNAISYKTSTETIGSTENNWEASGSYSDGYALATGKTLTFTFTIDESAAASESDDWKGYVAIIQESATRHTLNANTYSFVRSMCDYNVKNVWNSGALYNTNTYPSGAKYTHFVGATVNMAIKRVGKNVLITTAITKNETTYYHYYQQNLGTTDVVYAFLAADYAQLTMTGDEITNNGLTEEAYDFSAHKPASNVDCTTTGWINVNKTSSNIIANTQIEMNDRFAAQFGSGRWLMHKDDALYSANNGGRRFAVLNLKANDRVVVTFPDGYAPTFTGTPNAYIATSGDVSDGTALVSGMCYTIKADGMFALQAPNYGRINSVTIYTSAPVLSKPTATFNSMVESEGLYYPKYTFSSSDDGVKFYDGDGNDITSGYTFTSAGSQTVYAGKDGRTNSAKVSFSADKVGMILANSVNCSALATSAYNYSTGTGLSNALDFTSTDTGWGKHIIPGLDFWSSKWYYYSDGTSRIAIPNGGPRTVNCTVLNENRVATINHYHYSSQASSLDYLTNTNSSVEFTRESSSNCDYMTAYALYVNPSEQVSVTIGTTGYSTFSSPVPLNFAGIDGLTAYVATSVADGTVNLTSVTTAPANTGLVLKGTAEKTYNIPVTNAAVAPASNLLVGCIVETVVAKDATSHFNNYVLAIEGGVAKFQSLVDNGATIPAGKAFLKNGAVGLSARSMRVVFDDITGINQIDNGQLTIDNSLPVKRIVNGKLIIEKKGVKFNAAGAKLY